MLNADELILRSRARRRLPEPPFGRLLRQGAHLSQDEIASALGVTRSAVSRWESGHRTPRGATLEEYIEILDRLAASR